MLNKKYYIHIGIWSVYILYKFIDLFFDNEFVFHMIMLNISYPVVSISTFYMFYFFIWKPFYTDNNKLRLFIGIPLGLAFFIGLRYGIEEVLYRLIFGFGNYRNVPFSFYIGDNLFRASSFGFIGLFAVLFEHKYIDKQKILQLKNEKGEAEMAFLRSQLNPHFLFNTLNFLHTKAIQYDTELSETIRQLSEILRHSIQSSKSQMVPIEREVDLLKSYISIFQKRFEGNFYVDFSITGENNLNQKIEPILLMPLVENAFKHGVTNNPKTPVKINLSQTGNKFSFQCKNLVNNFQKDKGHGIGLENIKRRLELLYPNNHVLDIVQNHNYFSVSLELELNK